MASAEPRGLSRLPQVPFPGEEKEGNVKGGEAATAFCRAGNQQLAPGVPKGAASPAVTILCALAQQPLETVELTEERIAAQNSIGLYLLPASCWKVRVKTKGESPGTWERSR